MMIMMMTPLFEALHNEGRDASLSNDNSERRDEEEGYERFSIISLHTCHAVLIIDVFCACLIAHSDPETKNQLLVLILKPPKPQQRKSTSKLKQVCLLNEILKVLLFVFA